MNPLVYILILLVITGVFGLVCFIISRRAIQHINKLKIDIEVKEKIKNSLNETNEDLIKKNTDLLKEKDELINITTEKKRKIGEYDAMIMGLDNNINEKTNNLKNLEQLYQIQLNDKEQSLQKEADEFKKKVYEDILKEVEDCRLSAENQKKIINNEYEKEKANFEKILQEYKDKQDSIIKINKEQEEIREKAQFYQLHIKTDDLDDIKALQSIKPHLNHPEILDKLIYKTYYEKAYTDLIGRVIGTKKITGIYKLTNLLNEKVYIGQAVDIAERWRQHLKRAVGAEPMTTNKLYPAMQEDGPYNFTWQVVEECKKEDLTAREKYWIEFYEGQGYGYNIKG